MQPQFEVLDANRGPLYGQHRHTLAGPFPTREQAEKEKEQWAGAADPRVVEIQPRIAIGPITDPPVRRMYVDDATLQTLVDAQVALRDAQFLVDSGNSHFLFECFRKRYTREDIQRLRKAVQDVLDIAEAAGFTPEI